MTDKYPKLRQDLAAAIADAKRQGGVNERAEQIAALLAERDTLAAAPVSAEPVGYVSRDASIARMTTNLPEGSPLYAAPVAAQPDLTQQTLDDVMAGIPARDAEIAALRKEIETLQAAQAQPVRSTAMAEAKHPFRLAMSPLTRTIFAGRIRQRDGYAEAVGIRHDVTADFYECLIRMAESHDGEFTITANGEPAYDVIVRARKEQT
ncbi:MAG TPA: hypothetical protein DD803_16640 [Alcaligenes faecalis]|nr:hypothetical protein [Alcaligenes faecalis]HBQ91066.1 hypothetical protein [Alcaligenes faecalis]